MNLPIASIRTDGGTQPRAAINAAIVDEYRADMMGGATFPPVTVFFDGSDYWLADGFHRVQAAQQLGQTDIAADIHQGTLQDAQWHSFSANQSHGLRRSNEDKRRAVDAALKHPFAKGKSSYEIARHCGVSAEFVRTNPIYQSLVDTSERTVTRNGTTYTMNTANIGHNGNDGLIYPYTREQVQAENERYFRDQYNRRLEPVPDPRRVDPETGEIFTDDDDDVVPFESSPRPQNGQPIMPKPTYHAGNRSIGDQFHSKLVWNYQRLDLSEFDHFTIGYSQRTWEQFNELLAIAGVTVLMDVRRNAVSQYKPEFSKQSLQLACEAENLIYIHAPELGVDFEDRAELSETHDYDTLFDSYEQRLTPAGIWEAINRRVPVADQRVAFMCVEIDPCTCHRNRIAKALEELSGFTTFDL